MRKKDLRMAETIEVKPQPGPQTDFLATSADIAIYGGAAGGGKTWALLMEAIRYQEKVANFMAVFFRRTTPQIKNPGGLWDESVALYTGFAKPRQQGLEWIFPMGGRVKMAHMEYEANAHDWQGSQVPLICFDELTHFTERQFWYLFSRNRSTTGVPAYIRASCNPDPDSWVAGFIEWWIDQDTGYAIPERSGVVRWFVRIGEKIEWDDSREALIQRFPILLPKSVTFIPSKLSDNRILMRKDPGYLANLMALGRVERERLLNGNWRVRAQAGSYFPRHLVGTIDAVPTDVIRWVRRWDLAATEVSEKNPSPDATAGVLMGLRRNGRVVIADGIHMRRNAHIVRDAIKSTAMRDKSMYPALTTVVPQDPGQAGKDQAASYIAFLAGYKAKAIRETGPKETRAEPLSAQWQAGNVDLVAGPWNRDYLQEMEGFPDADHDDYVDASSGAYYEMVSNVSDYERRRALAA
jgi:predicted phage terminase large subunit-like protein